MLAALWADGPVDPAAFEPAWAAALAFCDAMTVAGAQAVSDEVFGALAAHWDSGQIVEIAMVVGLFCYFNRVNNALRVEVTR